MVLWRMWSGAGADPGRPQAPTTAAGAKEAAGEVAEASDDAWDDWVDLGNSGRPELSKDDADEVLVQDFLFEGSTTSEASGKHSHGESSRGGRSAGYAEVDSSTPPTPPLPMVLTDEFVDLEVARPTEEPPAKVVGGEAISSERQDAFESSDDTEPLMESASSMLAEDSSAQDAGGPEGVEEPREEMLQCVTCRRAILKASEIVSDQYRAMSGPGYLTSAARNVSISEEAQEAQYTSGRYTVKEVACEHCATPLGITYVAAAVMWNKHKVGMFLLGQDLLEKVGGK